MGLGEGRGGILISHTQRQPFLFILVYGSCIPQSRIFWYRKLTRGGGGQSATEKHGQRSPLRAPNAGAARGCEHSRGRNMQRPDSVHDAGGFLKDTFFIFKQVKNFQEPVVPLCNSNLYEGGWEAHGEAAPVSQRLPGRESTRSAQGEGGHWEPCHGLRWARTLVTATYQNCSLWNIGSGQMKKHISKIKT